MKKEELERRLRIAEDTINKALDLLNEEHLNDIQQTYYPSDDKQGRALAYSFIQGQIEATLRYYKSTVHDKKY